jgi:hypothetical protein
MDKRKYSALGYNTFKYHGTAKYQLRDFRSSVPWGADLSYHGLPIYRTPHTLLRKYLNRTP